MSLMKTGLVMALVLAVSGGGHLLLAQQGPGARGLGLYGAGPRLGENVAFALELQEELGLSADQVQSLQLLQEGILQDVDPLETEIEGLRSGILAGEANSAEGLALLREFSAQHQAASAPYRTQVAAVLTPAQHQTLQGIMWEARLQQGRGGLGVAGVGLGQGAALGVGLGVGRGAGLGLGRSGALGLGRGGGLGLGGGRGRG
jgi:hypothetical protein